MSQKDKLRLLGNGSPLKATMARVDEYRRLFAFRFTNAIVTRVGQGPRAWTSLPEHLREKHLVRHLLGDRIPGLNPVWYGARSFSHTTWFCIDIDADRTPEKLLEEKHDLTHADEDDKAYLLGQIRRTWKPKPPFTERLHQVHVALRRLGIKPKKSRQVLSLPTPSGGRHLYVFLDGQYHLEMIYDLLEAAGLKHSPGEIELFPRINQGLRLPFGHIPGQPHDPNAWIQFIDDYRNRKIYRFSLADLRSNLDKHRDRFDRQAHSVKAKRLHSPVRSSRTPILGIPEAHRATHNRFRELLVNGIHSKEEANELLALGIQEEGHRTEVLNLLAAHLIWFRHLSAAEAAEFLTTWALNPRHASKDIAADLAKGTNVVINQIATMCPWYEAKKQTAPYTDSTAHSVRYALAEIESLRPCLQNLDPDARQHQAQFLLRFLAFAKRYGTVTADQSGRDAAPAINAVVKKWPGCSHMKYKARIDHSVAAGVLTLVKEKWQNPKGKGRARTYRLHVPIAPPQMETLDYDAAMNLLTAEAGIGGPVEVQIPYQANAIFPLPEGNDADQPQRPTQLAQDHPPSLPQTGSDLDLGTSPRQRDPKRDAARRLPRFRPGHSRADRTRRNHAFGRQQAPTTGFGDLVEYERQRLNRLRTGGVPLPEHLPLRRPP